MDEVLLQTLMQVFAYTGGAVALWSIIEELRFLRRGGKD